MKTAIKPVVKTAIKTVKVKYLRDYKGHKKGATPLVSPRFAIYLANQGAAVVVADNKPTKTED